MTPKVAVVILNYNGKDFLRKFLPDVINYSEEAEIIIADNSSTDDSVEMLKKEFPSTKLIEIEENLGYAGGYNKALETIDYPYYVLLNSDVEVTKGWLPPLIKFMDENESVVACQPKILSQLRKTHFEHAGAAGGFLDKNYYPFCRGRIFETVEDDQQQYDSIQQVFWASGACMMVRAKYFHECGGFDSDFFAHMEEIDLSWRWAHSGYQSFCIPDSLVYHVGGGTLAYNNPKKTYLNFRNSLYMIYKNYPHKPMAAVYKRLLLDTPAAGLFLIKGKFAHFNAIWKAHRSFFKHKKALKEKRKKIHHQKDVYGIIPTNILWNYFIKKKRKYQDLFKN